MMRVALISVLLMGCAGEGVELGEPRQVLPYAEDGNLQLYVSNQSFDIDPVDIAVEIDGRLAVVGNFLVEGQHSWHVFKFKVLGAEHTIDARSEIGDAELAGVIDVTETPYAVLDYWYYPGDPDHPRMFSLHLFEEPPLFE